MTRGPPGPLCVNRSTPNSAAVLCRQISTDLRRRQHKEMLRRDLAPGPDQLREGLTVILESGVEIPATIDDHEERYQLWSNYFANEAALIRALTA